MRNELKGACILGQSGGPSAVINASAYGVIKTALENPNITAVYGASNGIRGVLDDVLFDMSKEDAYELSLLLYTPSSALGSVRYKLKDSAIDDTDYKRILKIFQKYDVRYFFYIGGNDSMDTCNKISKYIQQVGYECRIMGVPKTIDNDLWGTDHCPGYGSAAKYIATTCMELYHDARVYDTGMICVMECMGRHAGWLTAAAGLASYVGQGPDLIYLPERVFDMGAFLADVERVYKENGKCLVAVSEGIHDATGKFIVEYGQENAPVDAFGHKQLGGLAANLVHSIKSRIADAKCRAIEFSLMQRCATHIASNTDVQEAFRSGETAVHEAVAGVTDKMVGYSRSADVTGNYVCEMKLFDLSEVANAEKKMPLSMINEAGNGLTQAFIDYALPLIQGQTALPYENGLPRFARLAKIRAK